MAADLTTKQQAFVSAYTGEAHGVATEAARLAGYNASSDASLAQVGYTNLRHPAIVAAIEEVKASAQKQADTSPKAIKKWWGEMMHDPSVGPVSRLRASELLAKATGVFPAAGSAPTERGSGKVQSIQVGERVIEF